ncbi:MAG: phosphoribosylaminoimidazolecarboxamide formyltransferase [Verrucomicrobia subdivision 6 bacterium BACL9 MAG-120820-bin42]|uniref:Bifunctional purine biosynthesis protein PurH n=2 Tax=Verrucomicrobia subdivision 6 TaxID=134627 RepID=A0A0R2XE44_9BACT|nr:MAG: phosphoribosylaminoimidazolecarboxamide formyltransferase [Verrucomicrobia subdivision 6 bacterium BACL9 MAG-120507-bin52]KRP32531.1 MAG: phosphoribosylaminoimidazolecarboxamide formyltransferase [Verrucomicrobia subdivision 6 bacterium BACL9 MAG-120820-bin42]
MQRALLSVSDKTGLVELAKFLAGKGVELISTGGTCQAIRDAGIPVMELSDYTGFPEMMDGRVKTLHPKVHGGLLQRRDLASHQEQATRHKIPTIDLVVVNLYPFEQTVARADCTEEQAIENIDIGGPSMLRSAAKNHESVTVVTDPSDYSIVQKEMEGEGGTTLATRKKLAAKVFRHTSHYDHLIGSYLTRQSEKDQPVLQETAGLVRRRAQTLRYGENPHQKASLYGSFLESFQQLHGKELSYNNVLDLSAAAGLIAEFPKAPPTLAILKHTNPCGVGSGKTLLEAWERAYATDRQAPFGGIIVANRAIDAETAQAISEIFSEVILAPSFEPAALKILQAKKNLRLMENHETNTGGYDFRSVRGNGLLVQESDGAGGDETGWKVVTKRKPTEKEMRAMSFGWKVVRHVKSNAIVYAGEDRTLGIGAGQMSRVDSSRIAVWKAGEAKLSLQGSAVASDAFFPFPDGLEAAAAAGATVAIQPGGSVKDSEVIAAADRLGVAMVFTGRRHFRH